MAGASAGAAGKVLIGFSRLQSPQMVAYSSAAGMSPLVFISHSSKDRSVAHQVCEALERRGFSCWLGSRDIHPGENFQEAIVKAIRSVRAMVLVFTGNANNSNEIQKEIALASQNQLVVIPLRAEKVLPGDAFLYELSTRQWIDAFDDWDHAISRLADKIGEIATKAGTDGASHAAPGNLPVPATSFLGRHEAVAEVSALLRFSRLVTLTGVAGVGKTRLALQIAAEVAANFPEGAWVIELATISHPEAIGHVVAGVLGIPQQPGQTIEQSVIAALVQQRLLLLLDNCEHLLDAAASLAGGIINTARRSPCWQLAGRS